MGMLCKATHKIPDHVKETIEGELSSLTLHDRVEKKEGLSPPTRHGRVEKREDKLSSPTRP